MQNKNNSYAISNTLFIENFIFTEDSLLDEYNEANIRFIKENKEHIHNRFYDKTFFEFKNDSQENVLKNQRLAKSKLSPIANKILKTHEFYLTANFYLFKWVESRYLNYSLEFPDDYEMQNKWNCFKIDLSYLRFVFEPGGIEFVESFLEELKSKLDLCRSYPNVFNEDKLITDAFKSILDNSKLCVLSISSILGLSRTYGELPGHQVPIFEMLKVFNTYANEGLEDYTWGLTEIRKLLKLINTNNSKLTVYIKETEKFLIRLNEIQSEFSSFKLTDNPINILKIDEIYKKILIIHDTLNSKPGNAFKNVRSTVHELMMDRILSQSCYKKIKML